jgi:N utilization substance protein B
MAASARRQARIAALQTLYEVDATRHQVEDVLRRNLEEPASDNQDVSEPLGPEACEYARYLVYGVLQHRDELDAIISRSAPSWPVEQMSRVDKSILRVALFEILFDNKVPLKAAINEAVELAKRFGSDSSSRFINGVLGTVATSPQVRARSHTHKPAGSASPGGPGHAAQDSEAVDSTGARSGDEQQESPQHQQHQQHRQLQQHQQQHRSDSDQV